MFCLDMLAPIEIIQALLHGECLNCSHDVRGLADHGGNKVGEASIERCVGGRYFVEKPESVRLGRNTSVGQLFCTTQLDASASTCQAITVPLVNSAELPTFNPNPGQQAIRVQPRASMRDVAAGAYADVIARPGIGNLPGTMSEHKECLKKGHHHALAGKFHDHAWQEDEVIGVLHLGVGNRPPQSIWFEEDVGVGEKNPVSSCLLAGSPHGVRFAEPARGQAIFKNRCSICHKIGDVGVQFAPDISDSREKKPEQLLTDILQPNRAIDSNYYSYTATTVDGHVHTGVLAAETSTSVTLKQQEGKSETLRRDEIEELHNNGVSFMPEGLEKDIPMQDMADLISFIKNWRYLDSAPSGADHAKPQAAPGTCIEMGTRYNNRHHNDSRSFPTWPTGTAT